MTEECVFCGEDGTPWQRINGHLCENCSVESLAEKQKSSAKCQLCLEKTTCHYIKFYICVLCYEKTQTEAKDIVTEWPYSVI